ncbi:ATP-grasp fold amidoligase family protein [Psychrobacter sp. FDAARGOS_221]|uniref:ATP-grasp fold amidoligase family protein n=1 Tax=Psychrobacter sp. FDAARGOS_221 TaxID=1975705 RepID=UPI000BB5498B|nr:ATP-grasp fold amidoligase family protein [Psychrobacter sp. FDAARGOS_221]PNK60504.1 carboxylate--amine ligase [Psychrobacter sp. FDAARGOS_221]
MYHLLKKRARQLTHKSELLKSLYAQLNTAKTSLLKPLNDDIVAKINYKENTGKTLNLDNPVYFNEKLWWLKINYRNPLMTQCSDKVKVRDYIKEIGLEHILTDIQGVYDSAEDVPFENLKGKYFIKCNHVSGTNAIYDSEYPEQFDKQKFITEFNRALNNNYYYQSREWNYKNIKPKILVEKFIETESKLLDYKIFCFHGKAKLIFVDMDVASEDGSHNPNAKRNIYDREFNLQDFTVHLPNFDTDLAKKPENLEQMLQIAEKIAEPFIFCRVDLYNNNGEIKFGEITFYTGGATKQFSSEEADLMVSSWLNIS